MKHLVLKTLFFLFLSNFIFSQELSVDYEYKTRLFGIKDVKDKNWLTKPLYYNITMISYFYFTIQGGVLFNIQYFSRNPIFPFRIFEQILKLHHFHFHQEFLLFQILFRLKNIFY